MADKDFKTLDEQLSILKSRGLQIPDEIAAKDFLLRNNYYRISGYSLTLRDHDVFFKSATFQNIIDIYMFDHELRHILMKYIEIIEVTIKSIYAYEFTSVHGATGYLEPSFFTRPPKHPNRYEDTLAKVEKQKVTRLPHEAYLKHFVNELHQPVPLWAYIDLFTISDISFFYSISEPNIKKAVADSMGITVQGPVLLEQFMHSLTIIRNLCAHGSRLFNRLFEQKPRLSRKEQAIQRKDENGNIDNAHLFGFILIIKRLLKAEDFAALKAELSELKQKYPFVNLKYYGFPDDWKNVL